MQRMTGWRGRWSSLCMLLLLLPPHASFNFLLSSISCQFVSSLCSIFPQVTAEVPSSCIFPPVSLYFSQLLVAYQTTPPLLLQTILPVTLLFICTHSCILLSTNLTALISVNNYSNTNSALTQILNMLHLFVFYDGKNERSKIARKLIILPGQTF